MDRYKSFFRGIAYAGYCMVFLFAVYTFEKSIPDQIYVRAGETINYQFQLRRGLRRWHADWHLCQDEWCPCDRDK